MSEPLPNHLRHLLLPYDSAVVGAAYLGPGCDIIPRVRCTEDRPRAGYYFSAHQPKAGPQGRQQTAPVMVPPRPDIEDSKTAEGMAVNAARTGISATGGLSGLVVAHTVAWVMDGLSPGRLPATWVLDGVLNETYPGLAENHRHCLGREAAAKVLLFAVEHPDLTLGATLETAPWVEQNQFGSFVDSARVVVEQPGLLPGPGQVTATPLRPLRGKLEDRATPPEHAARFIVALTNTTGAGEDVLWDTDQAWMERTPGYALNTGWLPSVFELTASKIGGNPDTQTSAMCYFQGAATHLLPRPAGEPLQIYQV